ncbi:MAG: CRISPR-associated protein Cmr3 [Arenicella sp.]|jgi:CRISPR-associated protein Cmr3
MKTTYIIDPVDSLFFRQARPFSSGENAVGQHSVFPPAPHTVVGAIRAQWATQQGWKGRGSWDAAKPGLLNALGGDEQELVGLAFIGPELAALNSATVERLYPAPAALIGKKTDEKKTDEKKTDGCKHPMPAIPSDLVRLQPASQAIETDLGLVRLPVAVTPATDQTQGRKNLNDCYLTEAGLSVFLNGGVPDQTSHWYRHCLGLNLTTTETRVGNQIDRNTGRVLDGMLYSTNHLRLANDVRLIMEVDTSQHTNPMGISLVSPAHIALGGEGRAATITSTITSTATDEDALKPANLNEFTNGQYLVYVRTPIVLPDSDHGVNPLPHPSRPFAGLPGQVVSACLYPSQRYGEWLQQHGQRHSKTCSVIPAGSVIFMQTEQATDQTKDIAKLVANPVLGERISWGYGRVAIGRW